MLLSRKLYRTERSIIKPTLMIRTLHKIPALLPQVVARKNAKYCSNRYWQKYSGMFYQNSYAMVGGHPHKHASDIKPSKEWKVKVISTASDEESDELGTLNKELLSFRVQRIYTKKQDVSTSSPSLSGLATSNLFKGKSRSSHPLRKKPKIRAWGTKPPYKVFTWSFFKNQLFTRNSASGKWHWDTPFSAQGILRFARKNRYLALQKRQRRQGKNTSALSRADKELLFFNYTHPSQTGGNKNLFTQTKYNLGVSSTAQTLPNSCLLNLPHNLYNACNTSKTVTSTLLKVKLLNTFPTYRGFYDSRTATQYISNMYRKRKNPNLETSSNMQHKNFLTKLTESSLTSRSSRKVLHFPNVTPYKTTPLVINHILSDFRSFYVKSAPAHANFKRNLNIFKSFRLTTSQEAFDKLNYLTSKFRDVMVKPQVLTSYGIPFTLRTSSFFLTSRVLMTKNRYKKFMFKFKKIYFSFLMPNQVKKTIMSQKRRIILHKNIFNIRRYGKSPARFSYAFFSRFHKTVSMSQLLRKTLTSEAFKTRDIFPATTRLNPTSPLYSFERSRDEIVDASGFHNKGIDPTFTVGEVRISRIKFKPGYQRIWRRVRTALKDNLRLRFIYQQQLTKYLTRFSWAARSYAFSQSDSAFDRVVVYSRLLPDMNSFTIFFEASLLSLNGRVATNRTGLLLPNDFIQITVSVWYYVLYRWVANWTAQRNKRFRRLVFRKGLASRYKLMKTRKTRSYYTPNWIYNVRFDIVDVKPYLEVDYFSLSAFVLYDPYVTDYTTPTDFADVRVNTYRLYNWKYLT